MKTITLDLKPFTADDVCDAARGNARVRLGAKAERAVRDAEAFLQKAMESEAVIYGVNTGFGQLSNVRIQPSEIQELQVNLLRSHAVGVGELLSPELARAVLFLRIANLSLGHSGVSVGLIQTMIALFNRGVAPCIPSQGSVGASGDLAPLAHLALLVIGEGEGHLNGRRLSGKLILKKLGLKPHVLGPKEGLALINGTQFMTGLGCWSVVEARLLADWADWIAALSLEGLRGSVGPFDSKIHSVRRHVGQVMVAERMRRILKGPSEINQSHANCGRVQDPYSLRCVPQVHGASRDMLRFVEGVIDREINSVTDNPLVFPKSKQILSGGNFHGQIVAMASDTLAIAVAEWASISEQRLEKLMNPAMSELPAFLVKQGGLNSGFMIVQVAAASLVSENKTLCHPASVDTIPTSADKEDHVSMGAWGAVKLRRVLQNARRVLAMELLAAAQAIDFASATQIQSILGAFPCMGARH